MKYLHVAVIAILSFIAGISLANKLMQPEIDSALKKIEVINTSLLEKTEEHISTNSLISLEAEIKLITLILNLDNKGAPREYKGEQLIKALNKHIETLNEYQKNGRLKSSNRKAERLITEANALIRNIEFSY